MANYKTPIDLVEKEYHDTSKKVRENFEKGKKPLDGVDEKRYNKVKEKMSKAAKKGDLK